MKSENALQGFQRHLFTSLSTIFQHDHSTPTKQWAWLRGQYHELALIRDVVTLIHLSHHFISHWRCSCSQIYRKRHIHEPTADQLFLTAWPLVLWMVRFDELPILTHNTDIVNWRTSLAGLKSECGLLSLYILPAVRLNLNLGKTAPNRLSVCWFTKYHSGVFSLSNDNRIFNHQWFEAQPPITSASIISQILTLHSR